MRKILPLIGFVMVGTLLGAACSSDSKTSTTPAASTSSSSSSAAAPVSLPGQTNDKGTGDATSGSIELETDNFYFNPTFIKATPGATVKITVKNEGSVAHTFTSTALGVDQQVDPGKEVDVTVTIPSTLPVEFHCRFHQGSGMQGALFDPAGGAPSASASSAGAPATSPSTSSNTGYYN